MTSQHDTSYLTAVPSPAMLPRLRAARDRLRALVVVRDRELRDAEAAVAELERAIEAGERAVEEATPCTT